MITGYTPFHTLTNLSGAVKGPSVDLKQVTEGFAKHKPQTTTASETYVEYSSNNGLSVVDFTDKYLAVHMRNNNSSQKVGWGVSFKDSSGNEKKYLLSDGEGFVNVVGVVDPQQTADTETGTLDITDVTKIRIYIDINEGSSSSVLRIEAIAVISALTFTGGTLETPLTNVDLRSDLTSLRAFSNASSSAILDETFSLHHNIQIGDNDATYWNPGFGGLSAKAEIEARDSATTFALHHIDDSKLFITINTTANQSIENVQFIRFNFNNISSGVLAFSNCLWIEAKSVDLGTAVVNNGGFFECIQPIETDGAITSSRFFNSAGNYAFDWGNGSTTLSGCSFVDNASVDGALRITGDVTIDNLAFSGNTYDFFVDVPSGTITITVDAASTTDHSGGFSDAGYIAAKVNSAGATVVIAAPVASYTRAVSGRQCGPSDTQI